MSDLTSKFIETGGEFLAPLPIIKQKAEKIKAFVFDWDGVFNSGNKSDKSGSVYSEGDSMGTNLLRFGYFLKENVIPVTAIFTGVKNDLAVHLAEREHFNFLVYKCLDKGKAFELFLRNNGLHAEEVAFCFDDVLDIPIAEKCGLRFYVNNPGRPLFEEYIRRENLFDYKTGQTGGQNAVREISELLLGMIDQYESVIRHRVKFSESYRAYLSLRNSIVPVIAESETE